MAAFKKIPDNEAIRVVQVGCGSMAQGWIERTLKKPRLQLAGLVDIRRESAEKTASKYGLPPSIVYGSLKEALAGASPHAVFDITVPTAHYDVTLQALKAGCHVLGEKPLSDNLRHARQMCASSRKARRLYMVTQNRRHLPHMVAMTRAIKAKAIGALSSLDADFYIGAHFGGFRDLMAHVLILDMAIHTFDQARMLSGCDPKAVYCHEYNPKGSWYKGDAGAVCIFEMTNGVLFTYRGSWAAEGFNTSWESAWRMTGSEGTIVWDGRGDPKGQIVQGKDGFQREMKELQIPAVTLEHAGHEGILDEFIQALRSGVPPQTVCHDNIKSLAMCLAAVESAKKQKRVLVKW